MKIERTPPDILNKVLVGMGSDRQGRRSQESFFKKVYESQREYASKVVPARRAVYAPYELGANYYWPEK